MARHLIDTDGKTLCGQPYKGLKHLQFGFLDQAGGGVACKVCSQNLKVIIANTKGYVEGLEEELRLFRVGLEKD